MGNRSEGRRTLRLRDGAWALTLVWAGLAGCGPKAVPYPQSITAADPLVRVRAIKQAGEKNDKTAIPLLVDRLEDEDEAVRFYAILSLERIAGTRLGYDYGASELERRAAVERWREYAARLAQTEPQSASASSG